MKNKNEMIDYILSQAQTLIIGVNRVDLKNMEYDSILSFYENINKYREVSA